MARRPPGRRPPIPLLPVVVFLAATVVFLAPALFGQRTYAGVDLLEAGAPYRNTIDRAPHVVSPLQTDQAETLSAQVEEIVIVAANLPRLVADACVFERAQAGKRLREEPRLHLLGDLQLLGGPALGLLPIGDGAALRLDRVRDLVEAD